MSPICGRECQHTSNENFRDKSNVTRFIFVRNPEEKEIIMMEVKNGIYNSKC